MSSRSRSLTSAAYRSVAQHPDAAKGFATALGQAASLANAHHHESALILAKHIKQTPTQLESGPRVVYGTAKDPVLLQPVIDLAAKYGEIAAPFPARDVMAPETPRRVTVRCASRRS